MFQKVNILHFQLAKEKLFSCENISPSEKQKLSLIEFKAPKTVWSHLSGIVVNRFLKDFCFFQSKGTFLSSLIAPIYYSYNGNLSTQFSQNLPYKQTFYELRERISYFFCLSALRTDYFQERKRTFSNISSADKWSNF